jgi:hypothetical protein
MALPTQRLLSLCVGCAGWLQDVLRLFAAWQLALPGRP